MSEDQSLRPPVSARWGPNGELHSFDERQSGTTLPHSSGLPLGPMQQALANELAPLRESLEYLAARREQDHASLRAALMKWSDEVAQFRAQVDELAAQGAVDRAKLEATTALMQQEVATMGHVVYQVKTHQEIIDGLRQANVLAASQLQRMSAEQNQIFNQLMSRISGVQSDLTQQLSEVRQEQERQQRSRRILIAVTSISLAIAAALVILGAFFLTR